MKSPKQNNLETEYKTLQRKLKNNEYKGNQKTKFRWRKVDKHRVDDLFALINWRKYAEQQKRNEKAKDKFYKEKTKPKDKTNDNKKYIILNIKKSNIKKVARFHYFIELIFILLIDLIYSSTFGFSLAQLALLIPTALLSVITTLYFIINLINIFRVMSHDSLLDIFKYVILRMGEPGTGKSSSACYDSIVIAEKLWEDLQKDYWKIEYKINEIYAGTHLEHKVIGLTPGGKPIVEYTRIYTGDKDEIESAVEIIEAFEYYSENDNCIPCFWSNIPVIKNGKMSNKFTIKHLMQEEKILYKGIAFIDEIGSMLPPELSNNKELVIDLMFRFIRHFKEFHFISTEQDGNCVLISSRRVTAENKQMIEQTHILKPTILNWVCTLLEKYLKTKKSTANKVKFITNFRTYVNAVGFRKFKYEDFGNLQVGKKGKTLSRVRSFVLPPDLNCDYYNRTFRNLYKCKNKSANVGQFKSLVLSEEEIAELFSEKLMAKAYKGDIEEIIVNTEPKKPKQKRVRRKVA